MKKSFLADTSCLVAAFCQWHTQHTVTLAEFSRRIDSGSSLVIAAHSLLETYAVLTRLPGPRRLHPAQAFSVIQTNLSQQRALTLADKEYWMLVQTCSERGWSGGVVYDALLVALAQTYQIPEILTYNERDFSRLVSRETRIVVPS